MADMIKFYKGAVASLPTTGVNGAIYITTDEGGIYLGTGMGMKRLGDFIQVDAIVNLPTDGANTSALYYCVAENVLAKWNGSSWTQVNRQKTASELKEFLGLGSLAYLSEVGEDNLSSALKEKVNAAAEGNHSHSNKDVLDGITAEKVAAWDASEQNAKDYADGLDEAMNTRVEALEAIDHSHTFVESELNKIVDGDVAKWNAAAGKAHEHSFNEAELNKIAEGDVAKWNGVVADHLTSADKTTLENAIKEAKKAGTDANTNIEAYKVTNDARVLAVEEDIAEITGENGILAQAKTYSDNKLATARTEISAEIDADVKVVADDLAGYKTSNDLALAGVKATAEAAAVKTEVETALAGKVDKVEGKSLIADSEIARLLTLHNYDDSEVKADIAKKADAEAMTTELGKKVDKVEGFSLVSDAEIARLKDVKNYDDTALAGRVTTAEGKITALETESAKHALKTELEAVDAKFADYKTAEAQKAIDDEQDRRLGVLEGASATHATKDELAGVDAKFADYTKTADLPTDLGDFTNNAGYAKTADVNAELAKKADKTQVATDIANAIAPLATTEALNGVKATAEAAAVKTEVEAALALKADKSVVDAMYTNAQIDGFIAAEKQRAEGIEGGLRTDVDAILGDYLKAADKTVLQEQITANANAITALTDGIDPDKIDGLTDLVNWANEHAPEVASIKEDIEANAKAISDHEELAAETYETKTDAGNKLTEAKGYTDTEVAKDRERLTALESVKDDYKTADATLKSELQAEIDSDVKVVSDALDAAKAELQGAIETLKTEVGNQDAVVLAEAQAYTDLAKDEAIADAASKYETIGTAQGIVDGLKLSETYEPIGAEDRAIAAAEGKVNALAGKVYTKEEVDAAVASAIEAAHTWGEF